MRSLRILQINCRYREYGGEERAVENEADLLRRAGHDVRSFEAFNEGGAVGSVASLAVSSWNFRQAARLRRELREWRPDVAHVHNLWFSLSPSVIAALRRERVPVVTTIHNYRQVCASADIWRDGRPCRDCVGRSIATGGIRHGCYRGSRPLSTAVASSSAIQARLTRSLPRGHVIVPSEFLKSVMVEAGFDSDLFSVNPWSTPDPGGRPNPPSKSSDVYFVGRLEPETKGLERLVASWNRAKSAGMLGGLNLNLIGSGPLEGRDSIAGRDVKALGGLGRAEVDRHLLSGRALVVSSLWDEPFGLVAIEGFAAGVPVIGTDRGALPETIGRLGPDCLIEADREPSWLAGLGRLEDDRFVDSVGKAGRGLYEERFTPALGLERIETVYERAVSSDAERDVAA